jgi:hypothetical protein
MNTVQEKLDFLKKSNVQIELVNLSELERDYILSRYSFSNFQEVKEELKSKFQDYMKLRFVLKLTDWDNKLRCYCDKYDIEEYKSVVHFEVEKNIKFSKETNDLAIKVFEERKKAKEIEQKEAEIKKLQNIIEELKSTQKTGKEVDKDTKEEKYLIKKGFEKITWDSDRYLESNNTQDKCDFSSRVYDYFNFNNDFSTEIWIDIETDEELEIISTSNYYFLFH